MGSYFDTSSVIWGIKMLHGIEIMLERMKTHPEEFVIENKYTSAFHRALPYMTQEEVDAVKAGLTEAHRSFFTGEVMSIMAGEHEEPIETKLLPVERPMSMSDYLMKKRPPAPTTALYNGMNGTTMPSAFGAVPSRAEYILDEYRSGLDSPPSD